MSWPSVLALAVALAMDAFAVAMAAGMTLGRLTARRVFRLSWHFGLFQCLMPVLGWLAGRTVAGRVRLYGPPLAFALLAFVGGHMLWEAWRHPPGAPERGDPTRGWRLMSLSVAVSLDALAVGLSMAFLDVSVWGPSVVIGAVAAGLTLVGLWLGRRFGGRLGRWADVAGGLVLLGIGVRILLAYLLG